MACLAAGLYLDVLSTDTKEKYSSVAGVMWSVDEVHFPQPYELTCDSKGHAGSPLFWLLIAAPTTWQFVVFSLAVCCDYAPHFRESIERTLLTFQPQGTSI